MKKLSSTQWIIVSMIVGVALGYFLPAAAHPGFASAEKAVSSVFLRMIKSLIVPLLFGTLVVGIAGHGDDMKRVGRLAFRSIVYFEIITTLALAVGLLAVNIVKPGRGVEERGAADRVLRDHLRGGPLEGAGHEQELHARRLRESFRSDVQVRESR